MSRINHSIWLLLVAPGLTLIGGSMVDRDPSMLLIAIAVVAVATSIIVARRIARDIAGRPPGSMPNLASTAGTIGLSVAFFAAQMVLCVAMFFVGCMAFAMTAIGP